MASHPKNPQDVWANRTRPVQEDMALQQAFWRIQRVAWIVLALLILLSLLGMFAKGPLSASTATAADGRLEIEYGRFEKHGANAQLKLRVRPGSGGEAAVHLGTAFLDAFTIETIRPQPRDERGGPAGIELRFAAPPEGPLVVRMALRPEGIGRVRSQIAVPGAASASFTQFIYP